MRWRSGPSMWYDTCSACAHLRGSRWCCFDGESGIRCGFDSSSWLPPSKRKKQPIASNTTGRSNTASEYNCNQSGLTRIENFRQRIRCSGRFFQRERCRKLPRRRILTKELPMSSIVSIDCASVISPSTLQRCWERIGKLVTEVTDIRS